jgi:hypothetical protein
MNNSSLVVTKSSGAGEQPSQSRDTGAGVVATRLDGETSGPAVETFCDECGSVPCSCDRCIDCGAEERLDRAGRCGECSHGYACECDDCYCGPDTLEEARGER